jgi:hypothetical protein
VRYGSFAYQKLEPGRAAARVIGALTKAPLRLIPVLWGVGFVVYDARKDAGVLWSGGFRGASARVGWRADEGAGKIHPWRLELPEGLSVQTPLALIAPAGAWGSWTPPPCAPLWLFKLIIISLKLL